MAVTTETPSPSTSAAGAERPRAAEDSSAPVIPGREGDLSSGRLRTRGTPGTKSIPLRESLRARGVREVAEAVQESRLSGPAAHRSDPGQAPSEAPAEEAGVPSDRGDGKEVPGPVSPKGPEAEAEGKISPVRGEASQAAQASAREAEGASTTLHEASKAATPAAAPSPAAGKGRLRSGIRPGPCRFPGLLPPGGASGSSGPPGTTGKRSGSLLDPPQLGSLQIEVERDKENIRALFVTDSGVTRDIIETHRGEIRKLLEADGFRLEKFDVLTQQERGGFAGAGEGALLQGFPAPGRKPGDRGNPGSRSPLRGNVPGLPAGKPPRDGRPLCLKKGSEMSVSTITSTASQTQAQQVAKNKTSLSQADFMNLFVAQLQYQNPLEPLDQYQMASQMAQFSSLEALNTLNDTVKSMVSYQATQNSLQVASLVGKKVEISGNNLSLEAGTAGEGLYQLAAEGKVTIKIYNGSDQLVRTIDAGTKGTSKEKVLWDGRDQLGGILADGLYRFEVSAVDSKGQSVSAVTSHSATVRGISFESGTTYLDLGLERVTLSDLNAILG